jgi:uncharacterized membrane protein (UPF0127 family)
MKAVFNGKVLVENVHVANTFYSRLIGLMFSKKLATNSALLLNPCNSIHTCFMNYAIDVVFLDNENNVVKVVRSIKPWRMTRIYFSAKKVLELNSKATPMDLVEGCKLEFSNV